MGTRHEKQNGLRKWALLGLGIIALEAAKGETLSNCFARGMENPRTRPLVLLGMGATVLHLLDALPEVLDPFDYLGKTEELLTKGMIWKMTLSPDQLNP